MNASPAVVDIRRMTEAELKNELARIRAMYGNGSARETVAKSDQALAALYNRSGWTQEQLAKVEGKTRQWVAYRLRFGTFLGFATTVANSEKVTFKLTERRFRDCWSHTDEKHNDRQRFTAVLRELEQPTPAAPRRNGLARAITDQFADGKWHPVETIAHHVGQPVEVVIPLLDSFRSPNNAHTVAHCAKRQGGKGTWSYRIVMGGGRKVDFAAVMQELDPILKELEHWGKVHRAEFSPVEVLTCFHHIRRILRVLAQPDSQGGAPDEPEISP